MATGEAQWTIFPSLLYTLKDPSHVNALEDAVCAHHCGRFEDASRLFDDLLSKSSALLIVALERSDMLNTRGLEHDRILLLRQTLANEEIWSTEARGGEKELLNLLLKDAEYWAYGNLRSLLIEARNMRDWLKNSSIDDLSDIEVRCIAAYYLVMKQCREQSNWLEDNSDGILFPTLGQEPWTDLGAVRRTLKEQGRLVAATRIALADLPFRNDTALQLLCDEIIDLCEAMEASQQDPMLYRSCTTRLVVSSLLRKLDLKGQAVLQTAKALELVKSLNCLVDGNWSAFSPRVSLDMKIKILESTESAENGQRADFLGLAQEARTRKDFIKERQLLMASITATEKWYNKFENSEKYQALDMAEQDLLAWEVKAGPLAIFQAYALSRVISRLAVRSSKWTEVIEQYDKFIETFPGFDLPGVQERLLESTLLAAQKIKDKELIKKYRSLHNQYWLQCPFSEIGQDTTVGGEKVYVLSAAAQNDPLQFRREIHHPDRNRQCTRAMKVMLRWAKKESEAGVISPTESVQMFDFLNPSDAPKDTPIDWSIVTEDREPEFYADLVTKMYGSVEPMPREVWRPRFQLIEEWLLKSDRPPFVEARHYVLRILQQARVYKINEYWIKKNQNIDLAGARLMLAEDESLLSLLSRIVPEARGLTDMIDSQANIIKNTIVLSFVPGTKASGAMTDAILDRAADSCRDLASKYRAQESHNMEYFVHIQRARLLFQRYQQFGSVLASASLEPLYEAEAVFSEIRRDQSILRGSRSIVAKTAVSVQLNVVALYDQALLGSYLSYLEWSQGNTKYAENSGSVFLDWIQRSKARALNDGLGLEAELPAEIVSAIENSPPSKRLLEQEIGMLGKLPDLQLQEKLHMRKAIAALREGMRKDPVLKAAMDFRDGVTISHKEIEDMLSEIGPGVVFVEYVHIIYLGTMRIILYRADSTHVLEVPGIRMIDVQAWVKTNLDPPAKQKNVRQEFQALKRTTDNPTDPFITLARMNKLIEPLATAPFFTSKTKAEPLVKAGETIVFCPTKAIHRVPLHALTLAGVTLIERNPVMYSQSLSILRHCHLASKTPSPTPAPTKRTILHLLPSHHRDGSHTTISTGYAEKLARQIHAQSFVGYGHRKADLVAAISASSLLHFHGHIEFRPAKPLLSSLILNSNPDSNSNSNPNSNPTAPAPAPAPQATPPTPLSAPTDTNLPASQIFTTRLARGALVTLIGCGSNRAAIHPTDDLHGLVTAFQYAGAGSVVSTLWSIDDDDGLRFSEELFRGVEEGEGEGEGKGVLDVARAVRGAVLALMKVEGSGEGNGEGNGVREPYYWAGFVGNGFWRWSGLL